MIILAISHFEFALKQKPVFNVAYIHLADIYIEASNYRKAKDAYQKVWCMKLFEEETARDIFLLWPILGISKEIWSGCNYPLRKSSKNRKGIFWKDKSIISLVKLTLKKLWRNSLDIESLNILGFMYKLKGELNKALEYYERALRTLWDMFLRPEIWTIVTLHLI